MIGGQIPGGNGGKPGLHAIPISSPGGPAERGKKSLIPPQAIEFPGALTDSGSVRASLPGDRYSLGIESNQTDSADVSGAVGP